MTKKSMSSYNFAKYNDTYINKIQSSIKIIDHIFGKYRNVEIAISFDGREEDIVMLDIILTHLSKNNLSTPFIIRTDNNTDNVTNTIRNNYPSIKIIFLGTTKDDAIGSNPNYFNSDNIKWPSYIVVTPLIFYERTDISQYISSNNIKK